MAKKNPQSTTSIMLVDQICRKMDEMWPSLRSLSDADAAKQATYAWRQEKKSENADAIYFYEHYATIAKSFMSGGIIRLSDQRDVALAKSWIRDLVDPNSYLSKLAREKNPEEWMRLSKDIPPEPEWPKIPYYVLATRGVINLDEIRDYATQKRETESGGFLAEAQAWIGLNCAFSNGEGKWQAKH
jgi:hypothetical protein